MARFQEALTSIVKASTSPIKSPYRRAPFLTKDSNLTGFTEWNIQERFNQVDSMFMSVKESMALGLADRDHQNEVINVFKSRGWWYILTLSPSPDSQWPKRLTPILVSELETNKSRLEARNDTLTSLLDSASQELNASRLDLQNEQRSSKVALDDLSRAHSREMEELQRQSTLVIEKMEKSHRDELDELQRRHHLEIDEEKGRRNLQSLELRAILTRKQEDLDLALNKKDREFQEMQSQLVALAAELDKERLLRSTVQATVSEVSVANAMLEAKAASLRSRIDFLESDSKAQSDSFVDMQSRLDEAVENR